MPNTTNYSFPTPADTDLVKNGADAIRDLGDAVDTAMNTALGTKKAGMVLLNTTSFSGVASQSINDVFSATYTNYKIIMNLTSTTTAGEMLRMRMRVGGTDNTSSNYKYVMKQFYYDPPNVGIDNVGSTSSTDWVLHRYTRADGYYGTLDVYFPFATNYTGLFGAGLNPNYDTTNGSNTYCSLSVTTSYTGFTFYPSAGNMTGTVSVYGVNK